MLSVTELDDLLIDSCEAVAPVTNPGEVERSIALKCREVPGFARAVLTGSRLHGTATSINSGLDVFVMSRRELDAPPSAVLSELGTAVRGERSTRMGCRSLAVSSGPEEYCFIPMLAAANGKEYIPDESGTGWMPAISQVHSARMRAMSAVQTCAIRLLKTWNVDEGCRINPFAIEAIAIEAFTSPAEHVHWCLKHLFDRCLVMPQVMRHPLDPSVSIMAHRNHDVKGLLAKLRAGLDRVDKAWFMAEVGDAEGALGWLAMLLDPDLAPSPSEGPSE